MCVLRYGVLAAILLLWPSSVVAQVRKEASTTSAPATTSAPLSDVPAPRDGWSTSISGADALLGPGDMVEISVFDSPELSQKLRVSNDGKLVLTLIGEIHVNGMTADALRKEIAEELVTQKYVKKPQVTVFVSEFAGQVAYVVGEVNRPGAYPLLRSHRLLDLIAVAGGPGPRAGNLAVITPAGPNGNEIDVPLDGKTDAKHNPDIEPGDRITVKQTGVVYVLGEVTRPGAFLLDRDKSVTVLQALALAEGLQSSASISKATLFRKTDDGSHPVPINIRKILRSEDPDMAIQQGDILYIYGSMTRGLGRNVLTTLLGAASTAAVYVAAVH